MPYNEADTRAKLIDPKLKAAGWGESAIKREHYASKNHQVTDGRIYLQGTIARRRPAKKVDYLLRYRGEMIAVLEAKKEAESADAGLEQAKDYARLLQVPFAYSSNGKSFFEFNFFSNKSRQLQEFPSPDSLWQRYMSQVIPSSNPGKLTPEIQESTSKVLGVSNPLEASFCPNSLCGKTPRYYQEVAIRRVIERVIRGQSRILLTMATGTGKTFTAFQIVWKLKKSGWLKKPLIFIADRNVLKNQAYNAFGPFERDGSDPRFAIEAGKFNSNREIYFSTYQALDAERKGQPVYKNIPGDFFGLIIIDECHRSGFGKWNDILQHFPDAIQLGMTATPKQDESIDTYEYFCAEEPEIQIDPQDASEGTYRPPAFRYSLGQGIEDGFLAPYRVYRIRTTLDKQGLKIKEAKAQGADIFIPEGVEPKDLYHTTQFEKEVRVPDRTEAMTKHLADLMRKFDPTEKTMVFCVDQEHARMVSRILQNEFSQIGPSNYAVPIISQENLSDEWLNEFQDSDSKAPIVATTAELLSTGVDVPSCRNIVIMKPIASRVLFKQIVGRGSRIDLGTDKKYFRIIDYVNATRLFDEWDRPPSESREEITGPYTSTLEGTVFQTESEELLVGASVSIQIAPNRHQGPQRTNVNGQFRFENLPATSIQISVEAKGFRPRTLTVETHPDSTQTIEIEVKPTSPVTKKIKVEGIEVTIADEVTFLIEATGKHLDLEEYKDYTRIKVVERTPNWNQFHEVWIDRDKRKDFLKALERESIQATILAQALAQPEADQFDILSHIAFDTSIYTRSERAQGFINRQGDYLNQQTEEARKIILALLDKYKLAGVEEMTDPEIFRLSPFREMGQISGVAEAMGGMDELKEAIIQIEKGLYPKERA